MKKKFLIMLAALMLLASVIALPASALKHDEAYYRTYKSYRQLSNAPLAQNVEITLVTDKNIYKPGDEVVMELTVKNNTDYTMINDNTDDQKTWEFFDADHYGEKKESQLIDLSTDLSFEEFSCASGESVSFTRVCQIPDSIENIQYEELRELNHLWVIAFLNAKFVDENGNSVIIDPNFILDGEENGNYSLGVSFSLFFENYEGEWLEKMELFEEKAATATIATLPTTETPSTEQPTLPLDPTPTEPTAPTQTATINTLPSATVPNPDTDANAGGVGSALVVAISVMIGTIVLSKKK